MAGTTPQADGLVEMALEFGVSLNLPDLVQAIAARVQAVFSARGVAVALAHNGSLECVLLRRGHETNSDRKFLLGLKPLFTVSTNEESRADSSQHNARLLKELG